MVEEMYEKEYFAGDYSPILFGYVSIFYRINSWFRFRRIAALIRKYGGHGRILDVGCALGHSLRRFRSIGLESVGCDISAWATKRARKMNLKINIVRADALFLPFRPKIFNATTAFETLEHCSDLSLALKEIRRVTKSNGLVLVSVPTTDLNNTQGDKSHVWHMSLKEWLDLFRKYFRVLNVEFFLKFMKYVDGETCNTFIALRSMEKKTDP
ncbi:MAG: class I SAM-dependent methyltransferase [Candidatus Bathyarchaeota archaeon]|nr:MAG: class I SAM-dependent methyltransferase [Candidatus Bathyarchaeota archaeon]